MAGKEDVYDESITPLVTRIIELCKEHGIAAFLEFVLDVGGNEENPDAPLLCTTLLPVSERDEDNKHVTRCHEANKPVFTAFTITTKKATHDPHR